MLVAPATNGFPNTTNIGTISQRETTLLLCIVIYPNPVYSSFATWQSGTTDVTHVGKYDRADDRPKLAMLAANVGYQYWTDDRSRLG